MSPRMATRHVWRRAPRRGSPFAEIGEYNIGIMRLFSCAPCRAPAVRGFHPGFRFAPPWATSDAASRLKGPILGECGFDDRLQDVVTFCNR